ncbi:hypothetical protein FGIG_12174 [Fasciola gigantica]|uniref:Uncharacterized protein n=1 Tax=Fasciola gigantica TaxID=46835 RepID=A0A504Y8S6_FASGI|nr:hypothetical protein FGIG_12174 [Fasciola gigantica]
MNTCPPSSVLSSSTSWSGPIGLMVESEQNLDEKKQQEQHQQHLDEARQTRRSWARSKRISVFNANETRMRVAFCELALNF